MDWNDPSVQALARKKMQSVQTAADQANNEKSGEAQMIGRVGGGILGAIAGTIAGGQTVQGAQMGSSLGGTVASAIRPMRGEQKQDSGLDMTSLGGLLKMFDTKKKKGFVGDAELDEGVEMVGEMEGAESAAAAASAMA